MAGLFQVLYGTSNGFRKATVLNGSDDKPLLLPGGKNDLTKKICTRQFLVDWDGDGKLDLLTGNFEGTFFWFQGEGKGKFAPTAQAIVATNGKPLKIAGVHSDPFAIDWDGDGDLDLVSGSSDAGVYWAENTAGKGKLPTLKPFATLIAAAKADHDSGRVIRDADLKAPSHASRVWVADVNGDGKLDLLVGDSVTLREPAKGLSEEEMKAKQKAWQASFDTAMKAYSETSQAYDKATKAHAANKTPETETSRTKAREAMQEASREYSNVYAKRSEFIVEEMTGTVWLYLQK